MCFSLKISGICSVALAMLTIASASVPLDQLIPFGTATGDTLAPKADDGASDPILLDKNFTLSNEMYNQLWVNTNGLISMKRGMFGVGEIICASIDNSSTAIIPFGSDVSTFRGGEIYFRQTNQSADLQKVQAEIQRAFPNTVGRSTDDYNSPTPNTRTISWAFIATWNNVSFSRVNNCPDAEGIRNTFQSVLASDNIGNSYVIFLYNTLMWTKSNGGNCSGSSPTSAIAGFIVGDASSFLPGSCTESIKNIADSTNSGSSGKWVFSVAHGVVGPTTMATAFGVQNSQANSNQPIISETVHDQHHHLKHNHNHKHHHHHQ